MNHHQILCVIRYYVCRYRKRKKKTNRGKKSAYQNWSWNIHWLWLVKFMFYGYQRLFILSLLIADRLSFVRSDSFCRRCRRTANWFIEYEFIALNARNPHRITQNHWNHMKNPGALPKCFSCLKSVVKMGTTRISMRMSHRLHTNHMGHDWI